MVHNFSINFSIPESILSHSTDFIIDKYKNYFMKIKGVSRDSGAKKYTNKSSIRK